MFNITHIPIRFEDTHTLTHKIFIRETNFALLA